MPLGKLAKILHEKTKTKKKTQFCDTSVCECVCGLRFFCDSEESLCCSGVESTVCTSNHAWVGRVEREQQDLPGSGGGATRPGLENAPPSITREEEKKREFFFFQFSPVTQLTLNKHLKKINFLDVFERRHFCPSRSTRGNRRNSPSANLAPARVECNTVSFNIPVLSSFIFIVYFVSRWVFRISFEFGTPLGADCFTVTSIINDKKGGRMTRFFPLFFDIGGFQPSLFQKKCCNQFDSLNSTRIFFFPIQTYLMQ